MSEETPKTGENGQNLIPDEVLNSVFDDLGQLSGVNVEQDTRDCSLPPEPGGWPVFDWGEGVCSWSGALTEYHFPDPAPTPLPEPAPPPEQSLASAARSTPSKASLTFAESLLAVLVYVAGVLLCSFLLATVGWRWANDVLALDKAPKTVSVTIKKEDSISDVAQLLQKDGLIEYPFLFETFAAVTHKAEQITTGTFELSTEMDYSALLGSFRKTSPVRETADVTIPEGYTLEEVFRLLERSGVCSAEELMKSAEEDSFDFPFLDGVERTGAKRLEGYLFPDTYQFYKGAQAHSVLVRLLKNFQSRFDSVTETQQLSGYSVDQIVTIASIIEKETTGEDRSDIAGVIYNRLNNPDHDDIAGRLQMDSTVQYVLPERKAHLSKDDIAVESPYNTYVVQGLPAGPICNPGLECLRSALNPARHKYYYFMLGDDGEDHFFKDKAKFESFKAKQKGPDTEEALAEEEEEP